MEFHVDDSGRGQRLDHFLQGKLPEFSRSRLQEWVKAGRVRVDGGAAHAHNGCHTRGRLDWLRSRRADDGLGLYDRTPA